MDGMAFAFEIPNTTRSPAKSDKQPTNADVASIVKSNGQAVMYVIDTFKSLTETLDIIYNSNLPIYLVYENIPIGDITIKFIESYKTRVYVHTDTGYARILLNRRGLPYKVDIHDPSGATARLLLRFALEPNSVVREFIVNSYTLLHTLCTYVHNVIPLKQRELDGVLNAMAKLESMYIDMFGDILMPDHELASKLMALADDIASIRPVLHAGAVRAFNAMPNRTSLSCDGEVPKHDGRILSIILNIDKVYGVPGIKDKRYRRVSSRISANHGGRVIGIYDVDHYFLDDGVEDNISVGLRCFNCIDDVREHLLRTVVQLYRKFDTLTADILNLYPPPEPTALLKGRDITNAGEFLRYINAFRGRLRAFAKRFDEYIGTPGVRENLPPGEILFYLNTYDVFPEHKDLVSNVYAELKYRRGRELTAIAGFIVDGPVYGHFESVIRALSLGSPVPTVRFRTYRTRFDANAPIIVPSEVIGKFESAAARTIANPENAIRVLRGIYDKFYSVFNQEI